MQSRLPKCDQDHDESVIHDGKQDVFGDEVEAADHLSLPEQDEADGAAVPASIITDVMTTRLLVVHSQYPHGGDAGRDNLWWTCILRDSILSSNLM